MSSDGIVVAEKSGQTMLQLTDDTVRVTGAKVIQQAPVVSLTGDPAAEPTFLATSFVSQFWSQVLVWLGTHTHPTAMGRPARPCHPRRRSRSCRRRRLSARARC